MDYIGFDENGLVYIKDSKERVHVLTEKNVWIPVFQLEKDNDDFKDFTQKMRFEGGRLYKKNNKRY